MWWHFRGSTFVTPYLQDGLLAFPTAYPSLISSSSCLSTVHPICLRACHALGSSTWCFICCGLLVLSVGFQWWLSTCSILSCSEFSNTWCFWVSLSIFRVQGFSFYYVSSLMCPSPVSVFSPSCPRILTFFMCNVHVSLSRSVCAILFWWHPVSCVLNVVLLPLSSYLIKMSAVLPPVGCSPIIPCASVLSVFPLLIAMSSLIVVSSLAVCFPFWFKVQFSLFLAHVILYFVPFSLPLLFLSLAFGSIFASHTASTAVAQLTYKGGWFDSPPFT